MHRDLCIRSTNVAVIDGYQGKENNIIILDWVVVESLGFFKARSQVYVTHSQAGSTLYIMGNKDGIEKNKRSDIRVFSKLLGRDALGMLRFSLALGQSSRTSLRTWLM